jgi:hypothetical protein
VLSARVNLLTKTEQFDDAAWNANLNSTVDANSVAAPNGTLTGDKLVETATTGLHLVGRTSSGAIAGVSKTLSVFAKAAERNWLYLFEDSGSGGATFNLSNGSIGTVLGGIIPKIEPHGDGWFHCSITFSQVGTIERLRIALANGTNGFTYAGDGTSGIYIWGADLRVANTGVNLPPYQRVNTATDYDTAGFPHYLRFDGVDDGLRTNAINFTSTDKMTVFAGVRKLSDAAIGELFGVSTTPTSSAGAFGFYTPNGTASDSSILIYSRGTAITSAAQVNNPAPLTFALASEMDIGGPFLSLRKNGVQVAQSFASQGTGTYGNYPLYIGRRAGTSLPFNGHLYQLIVRGAQSTTSQIQSGEAYTNSKTKAYA